MNQLYLFYDPRDVAQPGSALRSGRRGRWFESSHPDIARRNSSSVVGGLRCFAITSVVIYYTYIIESISSGNWYYGHTDDLEQRLQFHNDGANVSTRNKGPWFYIFVRPFDSRKEAIEFENYLKTSRNKEYIRRAFAQYFL